jgi:hypothetical protein
MEEQRDIRLRVIGDFEIKLAAIADVVPRDVFVEEGYAGIVLTMPGGERIVVPIDKSMARGLGAELTAFAGPALVVPDRPTLAVPRSRG